jgi:sugar phosphate isomerase/epimerase
MPRPVILFSGQWTDMPLVELAQRAAEWGYQGLELAAAGDHFETQRSIAEKDYCQERLDLLARHDLNLSVLSCHRVSQAVCDVIDGRHEKLLPEHVWGDGDPPGVQQRALEEVGAVIRAAEKLGVATVGGFSGSPIWSYVTGYPGPDQAVVAEAYRTFARVWNPILDVCGECNVRYALEVHPGEIAFDFHSAEMALEAVGRRPEFGFTVDPSHFLWQGLDPAEFVRQFADRVYHVHIKDVALNLNGRNSLLSGYLPFGDPRKGWECRSPGRGGIDWEAFIRALNDVGYDGPLAVEWKDAAIDREYGAEEACRFVKRLDFEPAAKRN